MIWPLFVIAGVVALVVVMQIMVLRRARGSEGRSAPDTTAIDGEAGNSRSRVYYFHAAHCGPCAAMTRVVTELRETHRNLITVDVATAPALAREFGVVATPTFAQVEDGLIRRVRVGSLSKRQLLLLLQEDTR
ncbi:MAG: thioredoxin family protein [Thiotrichales bacterium]